MNYRHHYHAGNFADVMKHAALVQLVRGMQRKDKGFLYLDTHAGRGTYDLAVASWGDTLRRKPEHPDGIGRLVAQPGLSGQTTLTLASTARPPSAPPLASRSPFATPSPLAMPSSFASPPLLASSSPFTLPPPLVSRPPLATPSPLDDYLGLVRAFDRRNGNPAFSASALRYYPGSPWLVRALMRSQDRMALCEKHPGEYLALHGEFLKEPRVSTHELDGYTAIRAMLPSLEKRALILIDPSYEAQDEYEKIAQAVREALRRMPAATIAVWYPLTERARADAFLDRLAMLNPPSTFAAELTIAGESSPSAPKMRGCGMAVVNPPWQIDQTLRPLLDTLASRLAQAPGGAATLDWIVRE
jgi:23S rRNA (adenine2030-N6)-methyltransferase